MKLRLILGDQLGEAFLTFPSSIEKTISFCYAKFVKRPHMFKHHKMKIAFLFSAMRHNKTMLVNYLVPDLGGLLNTGWPAL